MRTLTHDDVATPPAGNATGTAFSGQYLVTNNRLTGCRCRVGSCASLRANVGATFDVTQTDGTLSFDLGGGISAMGGVDSDGSFHLGWAQEQPGNVQYALVDGRIATASGVPTGLTLTQQATGNTGTLDCDIQTSAQARYLNPLTAAFEPDVTPGPSDAPAFGWH